MYLWAASLAWSYLWRIRTQTSKWRPSLRISPGEMFLKVLPLGTRTYMTLANAPFGDLWSIEDDLCNRGYNLFWLSAIRREWGNQSHTALIRIPYNKTNKSFWLSLVPHELHPPQLLDVFYSAKLKPLVACRRPLLGLKNTLSLRPSFPMRSLEITWWFMTCTFCMAWHGCSMIFHDIQGSWSVLRVQ